MNASQYLYYSTLYSIIIPIFLGFYNRKYLNKTLKLVWLSLIFNFCFTLASFMPVKTWFGLDSNNFIFYTSSFTNIILKYLIYNEIVSKKNQKILFLLMIVSLAAIPFLLFIRGYNFQTLSVVVIIEAIFALLACLMFTIKLNFTYKGESLRQEPMFWITVGFLITNFLGAIMYSFIDPIYQYSQELFTFVWDFISPLFNTFAYLLYAIGLWKSKNKLNQY